MDIKLRKRISESTGRTGLSLEYYFGYTKDENGKIKHKRKFEALEYYLITNPKTKADRDHNKVNLEMAEAVRAKRLLASQNKQYGFTVEYKIQTNLIEYVKTLIDQRKDSAGNYGNWDSMLKHLIAYTGHDITFEGIDKAFVEGFKNYLAKTKTKSNQHLLDNPEHAHPIIR